MGNKSATPVGQDEESCITEIVNAMMPLYYHHDPVTREHISVAQASWDSIVSGTAPGLANLPHPDIVGTRRNPFTADSTGPTRFREQFFYRYFDIQPSVEAMFSFDSVVRGPFLGSMVHKCLSQLDQPREFRSGMVKLAADHIRRGVWAVQYGIVGEILFWALMKCLGDAYTREVETAWKVVFSSVLRVMVPVAVYYEKNKTSNGIQSNHTKRSAKLPAVEDENTLNLAASVMVKRGEYLTPQIV